MANTKITLLYDRGEERRPMRVAGFISGSGTNLIKILEWEEKLTTEREESPYHVALIFTDNKASQAETIANSRGVPFICLDIMDFYESRGHKTKKDLSLRPFFDQQIVELLAGYCIDFIALAGYMSIVSEPLLTRYPGRIINVHPANLTTMEGSRRKYTGDKAVAKAILAGEQFLYSTTHLVRKEVDDGEVLIISKPIRVELPRGVALTDLRKSRNSDLLFQIASELQAKLKETGDWVIFPYTIQLIAEGRVGLSRKGIIHINGEPKPTGFWL